MRCDWNKVIKCSQKLSVVQYWSQMRGCQFLLAKVNADRQDWYIFRKSRYFPIEMHLTKELVCMNELGSTVVMNQYLSVRICCKFTRDNGAVLCVDIYFLLIQQLYPIYLSSINHKPSILIRFARNLIFDIPPNAWYHAMGRNKWKLQLILCVRKPGNAILIGNFIGNVIGNFL